MRSKTKAIASCTRAFSRAWRRLHVITSVSDWFTELSSSLVIGRCNCFGFGSTKLDGKPALSVVLIYESVQIWDWRFVNKFKLIQLGRKGIGTACMTLIVHLLTNKTAFYSSKWRLREVSPVFLVKRDFVKRKVKRLVKLVTMDMRKDLVSKMDQIQNKFNYGSWTDSVWFCARQMV